MSRAQKDVEGRNTLVPALASGRSMASPPTLNTQHLECSNIPLLFLTLALLSI